MPRYRRLRVPGGTYFFTVALADRRSDLLVREVAALRAAMRGVLADLPVRVDAMVVLPDHLHAVWTLPPGDADFSTRWKRLKADFSKAIRRADANPPPSAPTRRRMADWHPPYALGRPGSGSAASGST